MAMRMMMSTNAAMLMIRISRFVFADNKIRRQLELARSGLTAQLAK